MQSANELMISSNSLQLWNDESKYEDIKKQLSPHPLTDVEFMTVMQIGKSLQLNPFLREIWVVKYSPGAAASIFIGRDGYRTVAQRNPAYDYHQVDAVYENDVFEVIDGNVRHRYTIKNRGKLMGAYCVVQRKNSSKPLYVYVELQEYSTGKSLWHSTTGKPATMIKKVAEAQALRGCFQELFAGTYCQEEMDRAKVAKVGQSTLHIVGQQDSTETSEQRQVLNMDYETGEILPDPGKPVHNTGRDDILINDEQLDELSSLLTEKGFSPERLEKALQYYKVSALEELTDAQSRLFMLQLGKI